MAHAYVIALVYFNLPKQEGCYFSLYGFCPLLNAAISTFPSHCFFCLTVVKKKKSHPLTRLLSYPYVLLFNKECTEFSPHSLWV